MYNIKKAKWIWANETKDKPNQYCQFIQEINIKKVSKEVKIYISATSDYVLYINGEYVSCRQYHDFPNYKAYDTIQVGDFLKVGKNRICVLGYNMGESTFAYIKDTGGIIYSLENGKSFLQYESQEVKQ